MRPFAKFREPDPDGLSRSLPALNPPAATICAVSSRFLVGLGAWLLGAVTATTGSMIAVNELAHGLLDAQSQELGGSTVSADLVPSASGTGGSPAASVAPSRRARAPAAKATRSADPGSNAALSGSAGQNPAGTLLESSAGSVMATCEPAGAYLLYWSPDQGFETDDVLRGPAAVASVLFRGPTSSIVMRVSCSGGTPVAHVFGGHDE